MGMRSGEMEVRGEMGMRSGEMEVRGEMRRRWTCRPAQPINTDRDAK